MARDFDKIATRLLDSFERKSRQLDSTRIFPRVGLLLKPLQQALLTHVEQASRDELLPILAKDSKAIAQWGERLANTAHTLINSKHSTAPNNYRQAVGYILPFQMLPDYKAPLREGSKKVAEATPKTGERRRVTFNPEVEYVGPRPRGGSDADDEGPFPRKRDRSDNSDSDVDSPPTSPRPSRRSSLDNNMTHHEITITSPKGVASSDSESYVTPPRQQDPSPPAGELQRERAHTPEPPLAAAPAPGGWVGVVRPHGPRIPNGGDRVAVEIVVPREQPQPKPGGWATFCSKVSRLLSCGSAKGQEQQGRQ